jgi:ABC-2 type transport system ATP-binding protein
VLLIHQGGLFHDGSLRDLSERLAPCRQVRLELRDPLPADRLAPYGQLESLEGRAATLLVPREQLTEVVARLLGDLEVSDLEVSNPPIEELIGDLFQRGTVA